MMVISMTAFAQEDVFSGDWLGANKEGDLKVAFTLNCDGNWQLNPYNENARCNGFMEVNMLEPGGRESLMATYEFYVESMNGNELTLSFVGGRRWTPPPGALWTLTGSSGRTTRPSGISCSATPTASWRSGLTPGMTEPNPLKSKWRWWERYWAAGRCPDESSIQKTTTRSDLLRVVVFVTLIDCPAFPGQTWRPSARIPSCCGRCPRRWRCR